MNKYFRLLGLSENATKDEVTKAYNRWVQKYRALDYADDPDYVRRKLDNLARTYRIALDQAETSAAHDNSYDNGYDGGYESYDKNYGRDYGDDWEKECEHYDEYDEPDNDGHAMRKIKGLADSAKDLFENKDDRAYAKKRRQRSVATERKKTKAKYDLKKKHTDGPTYTLDDSGSGTVAVHNDTSSEGGGSKYAGVVIAIILALLSGGLSMCGDSDDYDYNDYSGYTSTRDEEVVQVGSDICDSMDYYVDVVTEKSKLSDIKEEADEFAGHYFQMDSMEDLFQYMEDEYGYYYGEASYWDKVTQVMSWFGMPSYIFAQGYMFDEANDNAINNKVEYIQYLNDYYEDHKDEFYEI
ncbi:MAG TPA: hypothetical protein VJY37_05335 [Anaerovoracaceae bacterium]|nr:hypothetical protein [Anaerovoracaceae bacterium]